MAGDDSCKCVVCDGTRPRAPPLYLHSTDSPLNTSACAKWDDGNTLIVAQGCHSADLVHILRPHHSIGRLTPRSRQAPEV